MKHMFVTFDPIPLFTTSVSSKRLNQFHYAMDVNEINVKCQ